MSFVGIALPIFARFCVLFTARYNIRIKCLFFFNVPDTGGSLGWGSTRARLVLRCTADGVMLVRFTAGRHC